MSLNYVKVFEDGTTEATLVQPAYGLYDKVNADDNRDVYVNGQWHPTSGGELVTNGTFDVDTTGWTLVEGSGTTIYSWYNNGLRYQRNGAVSAGFIVQNIATEIGELYTIEYSASNLVGSSYLSIGGFWTATNSSSGRFSYSFIARDVSTLITLGGTPSSADIVFDNISVFKSQPTLGEPYPTQFTYLSKDGKLAEVEVADGQPVDIHYDKLAPDLVRHTIQSENIHSDNYSGKNACTAWVNFDGTTTPPTIRDSFNVSSVVRTATGQYSVYFTSQMDTIDYSATYGMKPIVNNNGQITGDYNQPDTVSNCNVVVVLSSTQAALNAHGYIQIFGGKA